MSTMRLDRDGAVFVLWLGDGENRFNQDFVDGVTALHTGHGSAHPRQASRRGRDARRGDLRAAHRRAEAGARGIVDEAVDELDVLPRAIARAAALAGKDRATLGAIKRGLFGDAAAALTGE